MSNRKARVIRPPRRRCSARPAYGACGAAWLRALRRRPRLRPRVRCVRSRAAAPPYRSRPHRPSCRQRSTLPAAGGGSGGAVRAARARLRRSGRALRYRCDRRRCRRRRERASGRATAGGRCACRRRGCRDCRARRDHCARYGRSARRPDRRRRGRCRRRHRCRCRHGRRNPRPRESRGHGRGCVPARSPPPFLPAARGHR